MKSEFQTFTLLDKKTTQRARGSCIDRKTLKCLSGWFETIKKLYRNKW